MSRLIKGLYGHEFHNTGTLFGLRCGQMRSDDLVHNGGWYNVSGEKLGWGDLSKADLLRIASELQPDETFIVLPESASFWNFVTAVGTIGSMCQVTPTVEAPGVEYVFEHARLIVLPNVVIVVAEGAEEPATQKLPRHKHYEDFCLASRQFVTQNLERIRKWHAG